MSAQLAEWMDKTLPAIVDTLTCCLNCQIGVSTQKRFNLAGQKAVHAVVDEFMGVLFLGCHVHVPLTGSHMQTLYNTQIRSAAALLAERPKMRSATSANSKNARIAEIVVKKRKKPL